MRITTEFVKQYQRMVNAECAKVTTESDLIEELSQNAWLEICKSAGTFDEAKPAGPWVTTVAQRACRQYLRNNVYEQPDTVLDSSLTPVLDDESSDGSWIEQMVPSQDTTEDDSLLAEFMFRAASLSEQEAAVFNLVYWHGQSYAAVAEKLGITVEHVGVVCNRLRDKLEVKELYHKAWTYHGGGNVWADWSFKHFPHEPVQQRLDLIDTYNEFAPDKNCSETELRTAIRKGTDALFAMEKSKNDITTSNWYDSASLV